MVDLTLPGGSTQLQMIYFKVPNSPKLCGRMWLIGRLFIPSVSPKKSPAVQKKTGNHPRTLKLAGLNPYQHPMSEGSTSSASRTSMCNTPWYWGTAPFLLELHNTVGTTNTAKLGFKKRDIFGSHPTFGETQQVEMERSINNRVQPPNHKYGPGILSELPNLEALI